MSQSEEYFIIHKKVLPDYFEKVITIKDMITSGANVSEACKQVGLSRSTFYKYKDYVNRPSTKIGKRVILSLKLMDEPGTLSNILNAVAEQKANVLAINQEVPVHNIAFITLTISINNMDLTVQQLVTELKNIKNVIDVMLLAVE